MKVKTLPQKREALKALRDRTDEALTIAGDDLDHEAKGLSEKAGQTFQTGAQLSEWLGKQFEEMDDMQAEVNRLADIESKSEENSAAIKAAEELASGGKKISHAPAGKEAKDPYGVKGYTAADVARFKGRTLGEAVVEQLLKEAGGSDIYGQQLNRGEVALNLPTKAIDDMILKTDMTTSAGWDPEDIRLGRWIESAQRPAPVVSNIIPTFATTMSTILYMEETTFTNNAAEAAENAAIAESALAFTERPSEVRKIGHSLPVTQEQLDDVQGLRAIIDQRLGYMLRARLDLQLLVGNGTAPNISGFHDRASIGSQAKGTDSDVVAIRKGINEVESTGFASPSAVVFHPTDWMNIRLLQTADGNFLFGPPSMPGAETIWGLQTVRTTAQTITQALVGDFAQFSALYMRKGITLSVTDSHASEFLDDILRIKATMRAALAVFRETAFCEVTGL